VTSIVPDSYTLITHGFTALEHATVWPGVLSGVQTQLQTPPPGIGDVAVNVTNLPFAPVELTAVSVTSSSKRVAEIVCAPLMVYAGTSYCQMEPLGVMQLGGRLGGYEFVTQIWAPRTPLRPTRSLPPAAARYVKL